MLPTSTVSPFRDYNSALASGVYESHTIKTYCVAMCETTHTNDTQPEITQDLCAPPNFDSTKIVKETTA